MPEETIAAADTTQVPAPAVEETTEDSTLLSDAGAEPKATDSQEEPKDAEAKETVKATPDKYEFKMPEGVELDSATLDLFSPIFKELGITNEGAQKLVDAYIPLIQSSVDQNRQESLKQYKEIVDGWQAESMKELGADADKKLASCGKAINKFGSPELRAMLTETGVGNHKELVKFMAKIGETISEDAFVDTTNKPLPGVGGVDLKKMYPSMQQ